MATKLLFGNMCGLFPLLSLVVFFLLFLQNPVTSTSTHRTVTDPDQETTLQPNAHQSSLEDRFMAFLADPQTQSESQDSLLKEIIASCDNDITSFMLRLPIHDFYSFYQITMKAVPLLYNIPAEQTIELSTISSELNVLYNDELTFLKENSLVELDTVEIVKIELFLRSLRILVDSFQNAGDVFLHFGKSISSRITLMKSSSPSSASDSLLKTFQTVIQSSIKQFQADPDFSSVAIAEIISQFPNFLKHGQRLSQLGLQLLQVIDELKKASSGENPEFAEKPDFVLYYHMLRFLEGFQSLGDLPTFLPTSGSQWDAFLGALSAPEFVSLYSQLTWSDRELVPLSILREKVRAFGDNSLFISKLVMAPNSIFASKKPYLDSSDSTNEFTKISDIIKEVSAFSSAAHFRGRLLKLISHSLNLIPGAERKEEKSEFRSVLNFFLDAMDSLDTEKNMFSLSKQLMGNWRLKAFTRSPQYQSSLSDATSLLLEKLTATCSQNSGNVALLVKQCRDLYPQSALCPDLSAFNAHLTYISEALGKADPAQLPLEALYLIFIIAA